MRKTLVLLAILASSALFLAATPGTASATATCSVYPTYNAYNAAGSVKQGITMNFCTDTSGIRYLYNACYFYSCTAGNYYYYNGWYDGTMGGVYIWAYLGGIGGTSDITKYPAPGQNTMASATAEHIRPCWYTGQHGLGYRVWYQLKSYSTGQWSTPKLFWGSTTYYVTC